MSLAENRVLVGLGKQSARGSPAAASVFPRWGDGTQFQAELKSEKIREGDGTVAVVRLIKNLQYWKGKINHAKARSIDLGSMLKAVNGTASDALSGTAKNGTIGAVAAGVTTLTYTVVTGGAPVTGESYIIDQGLATQEAVTLSNVSGAGPYTLTVPATKFAHAAAAPATVVMTHTFTPQFVRDWYTIWPQYQLPTPEAPKMTDAQFHSMTVTGDAGKILVIEYEWAALGSLDDTSAMTTSFDASSAPFHYTNGIFNIDGVTTGQVAPFVKKFKLTHKHPLDESMQTEAITLADLVSTVREIDLEFDLLWQDFTQYKKAYYGSASGTTDNAFIGTGSAALTFYPGGDSTSPISFQISIPNLNYSAAQVPDPKLGGKALIQKVQASAVLAVGPLSGGSSAPEVTYVLKDTQQTAF